MKSITTFKLASSCVTVLILLLTSVNPVLAEDSEASITPSRTKVEQTREQRRNELQTLRCERVKTRLVHITEVLASNIERISNRFQNLTARVDKTLEKFKEKGLNTNEIEATQTKIRAKVRSAKADIDSGIKILDQAKDEVCDNERADVGKILLEANQYFRAARADIKEAAEMFRNDLVPMLKQLLEDARRD